MALRMQGRLQGQLQGCGGVLRCSRAGRVLRVALRRLRGRLRRTGRRFRPRRSRRWHRCGWATAVAFLCLPCRHQTLHATLPRAQVQDRAKASQLLGRPSTVLCLLSGIEMRLYSVFHARLCCVKLPRRRAGALAGGLYDRFGGNGYDAGSYGGGDVEYQSPYAHQDRF